MSAKSLATLVLAVVVFSVGPAVVGFIAFWLLSASSEAGAEQASLDYWTLIASIALGVVAGIVGFLVLRRRAISKDR